MAAVVIQDPQYSDWGIVCPCCGAFVPLLDGTSLEGKGVDTLQCRKCGHRGDEPATPSI